MAGHGTHRSSGGYSLRRVPRESDGSLIPALKGGACARIHSVTRSPVSWVLAPELVVREQESGPAQLVRSVAGDGAAELPGIAASDGRQHGHETVVELLDEQQPPLGLLLLRLRHPEGVFHGLVGN